MTQLQDLAASDLASLGVDADDIEMLTIAQLGEIENVMSSGETDASKKDQVQKIIGE